MKKSSCNRRMQRLMRQVRLIDTTEGIRIDLVDDADFSMFQLGTTMLTTAGLAIAHRDCANCRA